MGAEQYAVPRTEIEIEDKWIFARLSDGKEVFADDTVEHFEALKGELQAVSDTLGSVLAKFPEYGSTVEM